MASRLLEKRGVAMNAQPTSPGQARLLELLEQWGLPKEAIAGLVGRHTLVRYPKRSPLFLQGSPADVAFAVFNGLVRFTARGRTATVSWSIWRARAI